MARCLSRVAWSAPTAMEPVKTLSTAISTEGILMAFRRPKSSVSVLVLSVSLSRGRVMMVTMACRMRIPPRTPNGRV